jgi:hypothetical protein
MRKKKTEKFNLNVYMVFIDYKKALNSVACKFVLQTPKNQGVQEEYIKQ